MLLGHRIDQYALTREDRREPFGRPCALAGLVDPGQRLQRDAEIEIVAVKRATEILPIAAHGQSGSTDRAARSEEHTSELQSLMRISYAVFCLKKKKRR